MIMVDNYGFGKIDLMEPKNIYFSKSVSGVYLSLNQHTHGEVGTSNWKK